MLAGSRRCPRCTSGFERRAADRGAIKVVTVIRDARPSMLTSLNDAGVLSKMPTKCARLLLRESLKARSVSAISILRADPFEDPVEGVGQPLDKRDAGSELMLTRQGADRA
jgi:hypothetical protein